jgi:hypothetical protein
VERRVSDAIREAVAEKDAEIKRLREALRIAKWYADEFPCSHLPPGKHFVDDLTAIEEALT